MADPLANGGNGNGRGRDPTGRFAEGNRAAVGRATSHAERVAKLRAMMLKTITPTAVRRVVKALVREAEGGNVAAAKELLDRAVGRPISPDLLGRIEDLESNVFTEYRR